MNAILLTQSTTPVIGQVAWILGKIMEGIFTVIDFIGIPNIGLAIILFTIIVNLLMMPLTIKQQKFSKLSAKMNPEIQAIQAKYKNKKDNDSMMAQNQEVQAVYAKYGVSPTGSCMYLLIQMPILFALYKVIYAMPAYVGKIGDTFRVLADRIVSVDGASFLQNSGIDSVSKVVSMYGQSMLKDGGMQNGIIDVLNKLSSTDMAAIAQHYDLSGLTYQGQLILSNDTTRGLIDTYNNFFGLNMANTPQHILQNAMAIGSWALIIGALAIPVLSAVTQWISVKLMPQQDSSGGNEQAAAMASSMKMMNMFMPLMSAWFCFTFPAGIGLYWIAGNVVRGVQQVLINRHIDKMDMDEIIQKNSKKSAKKMEKLKANQERMNAYANMNTKNIKTSAGGGISDKANTSASGNTASHDAAPLRNSKPGSMMSKANMVKDFNEKNNKQ